MLGAVAMPVTIEGQMALDDGWTFSGDVLRSNRLATCYLGAAGGQRSLERHVQKKVLV
jgi:hypothetical protein